MKNDNFLSIKDTFAICPSPIICLLVCPQSFVNLFLKFLLDVTVVPRAKTMLIQNFGGHTRGIMGDVLISLCIILSDEK